MNTNPNQAKSIFLHAVEISSAEERAAYVDAQCKGDEHLHHEVNDLLRHHQGLGSFLGAPAIPPTPTVAQPVAERPGTVIGPYKLLQQIGEGGMGTVYMAKQTQPVQRKVALKVIKAGMDSRQVIARFEAELQALAMMDHVNIARVFDAGATDAGRPYFVMELVHGVPITKYCDDNHLTPRERLELFVPVCQAIQHAHQKGIIHRDIKPSNVMVTLYDGKPVPKVIDFGVAKATEQKLTERTLFTQYGTMIGTLEYMSPEQAEMSALGVDTRSDIYSLGVLLYELLTGSTPLTRKRMKKAAYAEILRMIKEEEPPKPSTRLSDSGESLASISAQRHMEPAQLTKLVRGELDWIVMKTLEKDRNRRYETANGFAVDVQRYLNDEPVQACPPSAGYRVRKFARRNRGALTTMALVAVALIFAVVTLAVSNIWVAWERDEKGRALTDKEVALEKESAALGKAKVQEELAKRNAAKAEEQEKLARKNADDAKKSAADATKQQGFAEAESARAKEEEKTARWHLYTARMNLADQAWREGHVGRALQLLEDQRPGPGQDDPRGFEWYYLWRNCHQGHRFTLRGHRGIVSSVAYAPDGKTLASGSFDGTVKLWDAATGQLRSTLRGHGTAVSSVAYAPDGDTIASASHDGTIRLWDVAALRELAVIDAHLGSANCVAFSPDGKTLASAGGAAKSDASKEEQPGEVHLWDVSKRTKLATLKTKGGVPTSVAFSPDGKRLSHASHLDPVKVSDVATGEEISQFGGDWVSSGCVAFSPDGKTLAVGEGSTRVCLWDLSSRQESVLHGHAGPVHGVAFSPDGRTLASASADGGVKLWDPATRQSRAFGHNGAVRGVAFSPDGKTLATASADQTVMLWDLTPQPIPADQNKPRGAVWAFGFSPDGKTVASASNSEAAVELWDVSTGQVRTRLQGHTQTLNDVVFAPDGKTLASSAHDHTVKLWDLGTGQTRFTMQGHTGHVHALAFSPDGLTLASGSNDTTVRLWDPVTGRAIATLKGHVAPVWSLAFSPDSKTLVSGLADCVKIWDLPTKQPRATLQCRGAGSHALSYSPDGKSLAARTRDRAVEVWDLSTLRERTSIGDDRVAASARGLAIDQDWKFVARGHSDGSVSLWDLATGRERATLKGQEPQVWSIALSPDGKTLVTGTWHGVIKFWRAATEEDVLAQSHVRDRREHQAARLGSEGIRLRHDGRRLEAVKAHRQALELYAQLAVQFPGIVEYRYQLAWSHFALALDWADTKQPGEGEKCYRQAIEMFEKLIAEFPADPDHRAALADATNNLGALLGRAKRAPEAERAYRRSIDLRENLLTEYPSHTVDRRELARTLNNLAGVLQARGRADEAKLVFERHLRILEEVEGNDAEALSMRGSAHARLGQWDKVVDDFSKAIEREPNKAEFYTQRGQAYCYLQQWNQAIADLSRALELKPDDEIAWFQRARAYVVLRQWDKAAADFSKVIDLKPAQISAWQNRAISYVNRGQWSKAAADFAKIVELTPENAVAWNQRGVAYEKLGQKEKAAADFAKAAELAGDDAQDWFKLGQSHDVFRRWQDGIRCYTRAVELKPDYAEAWEERGASFGVLKEWDKAVGDFSKAIELRPVEWKHWSDRGYARTQMGHWEKAAADFSKAIELARDKKVIAALYRYRAMTNQQLVRHANALADFEKVLELTPDSTDAHNSVAWLLAICPDAKLRDPKRAIELGKKAVELRNTGTPGIRSAWRTTVRGSGRMASTL